MRQKTGPRLNGSQEVVYIDFVVGLGQILLNDGRYVVQ